MTKVHTENGYDFYIGKVMGVGGFYYTVYNIVPEGAGAPKGGYRNMYFIEKVKGVRFPDRYQHKLYGTIGPYPNDDYAGG